MIKYVLKTNSNYYGNGYIKEFYNNYGACDHFHVSNNIFDVMLLMVIIIWILITWKIIN